MRMILGNRANKSKASVGVWARVLLIVAALGLVALGCADKGTTVAAPPPPSSTNATPVDASTSIFGPKGFPTNAQPRLQTMKLYVGAETITSELAMTPAQVGTGMMFRKTMAEDEGMLFVFIRPHRTSFYMKNTTVPLSAAYIDPDGVILEIVDLQPLEEKPVEAKTDNVQYVLEMKQGWFKRHNIVPGAFVTSEMGKFREIFRPAN